MRLQSTSAWTSCCVASFVPVAAPPSVAFFGSFAPPSSPASAPAARPSADWSVVRRTDGLDAAFSDASLAAPAAPRANAGPTFIPTLTISNAGGSKSGSTPPVRPAAALPAPPLLRRLSMLRSELAGCIARLAQELLLSPWRGFSDVKAEAPPICATCASSSGEPYHAVNSPYATTTITITGPLKTIQVKRRPIVEESKSVDPPPASTSSSS
mmetsp:Transcript_16383/g.42927  ORF Transcript_16383/g.42927 Transcript_16383/m.42927 type:complete len:212 (+) Transcript_16383:179-814(+)